MKLKLLLCSCCALLFCSLSSNAQSEREVRMCYVTKYAGADMSSRLMQRRPAFLRAY
jgi:hypothetical protein